MNAVNKLSDTAFTAATVALLMTGCSSQYESTVDAMIKCSVN